MLPLDVLIVTCPNASEKPKSVNSINNQVLIQFFQDFFATVKANGLADIAVFER